MSAPVTCPDPLRDQQLVHKTTTDLTVIMEAPETPRPHKVLALETPSKIRNRDFPDSNSSYVEEDDATYVPESDSDWATSSDDEACKEQEDVHVLESLDSDTDESTVQSPPGGFYDFLVRNEIPRKVFHSFHGFLTLFLYCHGVQKQQLVAPLWGLFVVLLTNDIVRFRFPAVNKLLVRTMGFIIRESEVNSWNGVVFYLLGLAIVFTLAPKDISVMSVLLLSWADTAASTFGRQFGKYTPKVGQDKSLAGCMASGFTGLVACYLFYGYYVPKYSFFNGPGDLMWTPETSHLSIHAYAVVCAVAASVSEAVDIGLDDNFTIPVLGSVLLAGSVWVAKK